jgi:hypothetical protein
VDLDEVTFIDKSGMRFLTNAAEGRRAIHGQRDLHQTRY